MQLVEAAHVAPVGGEVVAPPLSVRKLSTAGRALCVFALTMGCLTFPRSVLWDDGESSWAAVLFYAFQHGLHFGKDIVFTYGPLGFLSSPYFIPEIGMRRFFFDLFISGTVSIGASLLAWRIPPLWRWLWLISFFMATASTQIGSQDLTVDLGFLCWGMLCISEQRAGSWASVLTLATLTAVVSLSKFTWLLGGVTTIGCVALVDLLQQQRGRATVLITVYLGCFLAGWILLGQPLRNIASYLASGYAISEGYTQAMAVKPVPGILLSALLVGLIAISAIATGVASSCRLNSRKDRWPAAVVSLWLLMSLFLVWKHGFVRGDRAHYIIFFGFAPVLAICPLALPARCPSIYRWCQASVLWSCLVAFFVVRFVLSPCLAFSQCLSRAAQNLTTLLAPGKYCRELEVRAKLRSVVCELPALSAIIGEAPVDAFGNRQIYTLKNGLNYHPRPVFESYSVYSGQLMRLNQDFYASARAPLYVMVNLDAIDKRFAPLEDAMVFRQLLTNYEPVAEEKSMLLLRRRHGTASAMKLLLEGEISPGQEIDLAREPAKVLWLEIELEPSVLGRLRTLLYQPAACGLLVKAQTIARFEAPAVMMSSGFVASPVLNDQAALRQFSFGGHTETPLSYTVDVPRGTKAFWKDRIKFRLYSIDRI